MIISDLESARDPDKLNTSNPPETPQNPGIRIKKNKDTIFTYASYYEEGSSAPRIISAPKTKWRSGPAAFIDYMNNVYLPRQMKKTNDSSPFVYKKRSDTGMAGQLIGVCDVLQLSIAFNRTIKMVAPSLPDHLFAFPLFNLTYPVQLGSSSEEAHLNFDVAKVAIASIPEHVHIKRDSQHWFYQNDTDFNRMTRNGLIVTSMHTLSPFFVTNRYIQRSFESILHSIPSILSFKWYPVCLRSLFQLSDYALQRILPYYHQIEGHSLIGIHIRSGGKYSNWKDFSYFSMHPSRISKCFPILNLWISSHPDTLIYVASDSDELEAFIWKRYRQYMIPEPPFPKQHVGKHAEEGGVIRALLDLYILSKSNMLLLTKLSGFSQLAAYLNERNPKIVFF